MSNETILIVDDEPENLNVLSALLGDQYCVRAANSGERALEVAHSEPRPDMILLDIMMPEMNGYTVLENLKSTPSTMNIPVIFFTAMDSEEDEKKGLMLGAVDYITKPIKPPILMARVKNHLMLKAASDFLLDKNTYLESEVFRRMEENQLVQDVSIRALAHLAEIRDPETGDHILRTQSYVELLAKCLQKHAKFSELIDDKFIQLLTKSAPLHDIGKVGIPDYILLKQDELSHDEWVIMKRHAEFGATAIENAEEDVDHELEFLTIAKEVARWHHERWDGTGYPDGLAGEDIPLSSRIMAIADVFDALISVRVYKTAMSYEEAKKIISFERGLHFDPDIADVFIENFEGFTEIADAHKKHH